MFRFPASGQRACPRASIGRRGNRIHAKPGPANRPLPVPGDRSRYGRGYRGRLHFACVRRRLLLPPPEPSGPCIRAPDRSCPFDLSCRARQLRPTILSRSHRIFGTAASDYPVIGPVARVSAPRVTASRRGSVFPPRVSPSPSPPRRSGSTVTVSLSAIAATGCPATTTAHPEPPAPPDARVTARTRAVTGRASGQRSTARRPMRNAS